MIVHYGYFDASGEYYIAIDTEKCRICIDKPCISACPASIFYSTEDDYGDKVVVVREDKKNKLKYECTVCKSKDSEKALPCITACSYGAIRHSW